MVLCCAILMYLLHTMLYYRARDAAFLGVLVLRLRLLRVDSTREVMMGPGIAPSLRISGSLLLFWGLRAV